MKWIMMKDPRRSLELASLRKDEAPGDCTQSIKNDEGELAYVCYLYGVYQAYAWCRGTSELASEHNTLEEAMRSAELLCVMDALEKA